MFESSTDSLRNLDKLQIPNSLENIHSTIPEQSVGDYDFNQDNLDLEISKNDFSWENHAGSLINDDFFQLKKGKNSLLSFFRNGSTRKLEFFNFRFRFSVWE